MWAQMTQGSGPEGTGPPIRLFGYSPSRSVGADSILTTCADWILTRGWSWQL